MSQEVLVLNSDYEPLNVCNLRRAIVLVYLGKADILHERTSEEGSAVLTSAEGASVQAPSVVKLRSHVKRPLPELKLSSSKRKSPATRPATAHPDTVQRSSHRSLFK
jgi:hypothetical protein